MTIAAIFLTRKTTAMMLAGLSVWLVYVGTLSYLGVVRNSSLRPPGVVYIVLPAISFVLLFLALSQSGARLAMAIPVWVVLSLQSFRIGVELLLHRLWIDGLVPRMMTYVGGNVDLFVGLSAPLAAWLSTKGRSGKRLALVWNVLGLLALTNVVIRAILTTPGPLNLIHAEVPDLAIGTFPFTFIAGFLAPLAFALHVISIRGLRRRLSEPN